MPYETPCQKFNLVVYYKDGIRLSKRNNTTPLFYENVYIYNDEKQIYAYDAALFNKDAEDYVVEMMYQVISVSFKYNGIHINGLELNEKNFNYVYQDWLVTNMTEKQLKKENYYGRD